MGVVKRKANGAAYYIACTCEPCSLLGLMHSVEMEVMYPDGYVETVPIVWDDSPAPSFRDDDK